MSSSQAHEDLLPFLTPELRLAVIENTNSVLLRIIHTNFNTQYASKAPLLAKFRNAISDFGSVSNTDLVDNFRRHVPLSDYEAYKPFMAAFNNTPHCKEADVKNLFAPGFPYLLAISSGTSGKEPKIIPQYYTRTHSIFTEKGITSGILFYGYREVKYVERESGQIVKKIPVANGSTSIRLTLGWSYFDEDDSWMSTTAPGCVSPFAASLVVHHQSFLAIHALFTLACTDTEHIIFTFSTLFYDLLQYVDEQWDMFLSAIKSGIVPDLPGVHKVHAHLQVCFHANPDRSAELRNIGPPSSCEGWAARVWPKLKTVKFGCSGTFATVLPKIKSIIGPTVAIRSNIYASSESFMAFPYQPSDPYTFVLRSDDLIEFLGMTTEESHENLLQAWELEVGKQYEVVLTTRNGLWRYRLGDVIDIVGFDPDKGSPVFVLRGRRSLSIRLAPVLIPDSDIIYAIRAISPDVLRVNEFTTVLDDRQGVPTVGYLIELEGTLGPNAHLACTRLSEGLSAANIEYRIALQDGEIRNPSVRILQPGTFAAFRQWKVENAIAGPGQMKVPVVLLAKAVKEWILERVASEL